MGVIYIMCKYTYLLYLRKVGVPYTHTHTPQTSRYRNASPSIIQTDPILKNLSINIDTHTKTEKKRLALAKNAGV